MLDGYGVHGLLGVGKLGAMELRPIALAMRPAERRALRRASRHYRRSSFSFSSKLSLQIHSTSASSGPDEIKA